MNIHKIEHLGIAVHSVTDAEALYSATLGLPVVARETLDDMRLKVVKVATGECVLELLEPLEGETVVSKFLATHGPGIHHICFEVDDIRATLAALKAKGVRLIDETPTIGTGGKKIAFVHPESTHGVLVELYELTPQEHERRLERQRGLADRVLREGQVMTAAVMGFLNTLVWGDADAQAEAAPAERPNGY